MVNKCITAKANEICIEEFRNILSVTVSEVDIVVLGVALFEVVILELSLLEGEVDPDEVILPLFEVEAVVVALRLAEVEPVVPFPIELLSASRDKPQTY